MSELAFDLGSDLGGPDTVPIPAPTPLPGDAVFRNQTELALSRLAEQFKRRNDLGVAPPDEPNVITKFLTAICDAGVQPLWACLQQLLSQRDVNTAVGVQLDVIGKIVGRDREGVDDETYRRLLSATISAKHSRGTMEDLLKVLDLVLFDDAAHFQVTLDEVASVRVQVEDVSVNDTFSDILLEFAQQTVSSGVRVIITTGDTPPSNWFRFDSGPGFDVSNFVNSRDNT